MSLEEKKMRNENTDQLEEIARLKTLLAEREQEIFLLRELQATQKDIVRSLSGSFLSIFYIDLETGSFQELRETRLPWIHDMVEKAANIDELLDMVHENCVRPGFQEQFRQMHDMRTIAERLKGMEVIQAPFQGNRIEWCMSLIFPVHLDESGKIKSIIWSVRSIVDVMKKDIIHQQELSEALKLAESANDAKTSFLFSMSHDIRTPMNAIIGFTGLLRKYQEDAEKRADYLKKIEDSSSVLLSIINNVLEMARIDKGTVFLDHVAWSTEQFDDSIFSVFHELMKQKNIDFQRDFNVQHPYVFCDPIKLREIYINILSNAFKYTNEGGMVRMTLEELPSEKEGWGIYRTTVTDTGIGMSEEFLPHVFEEFTREQNTTQNRIEGTGLGMPIVKRLIDIMDGTIEVKSKKGEGTTFILSIPHQFATREDLTDTNDSEIDPSRFIGKRLLLAEDNELNSEIALEMLSSAGFLVDHAPDGRICLDIIREKPAGYYALILMDIQMPVMNGYETTRAIRALEDKEKAEIPILAMTANAFEEDKKEAMKAGMDGHLAKPINAKHLIQELSNIIRE